MVTSLFPSSVFFFLSHFAPLLHAIHQSFWTCQSVLIAFNLPEPALWRTSYVCTYSTVQCSSWVTEKSLLVLHLCRTVYKLIDAYCTSNWTCLLTRSAPLYTSCIATSGSRRYFLLAWALIAPKRPGWKILSSHVDYVSSIFVCAGWES